jgi:hypothetical protein
VVRRADGTPAPEATVALWGDAAEPLATATTDADGRYTLPDLPGARGVCAHASGSAPATAEAGDLLLTPGVAVEGRIEGARDGALLVYGRLGTPHGDLDLPLRATWPVGADGTFAGRLPEGAEAWARYDGLPVALRSGVVKLPPRGRVVGDVVCADGTPAPFASVLFRPQLDRDFATELPGWKVDADGDGRFEAKGVALVRYAVEVRAKGCATRVFADVAPGAEPLRFRLEPGFAVEGRIIDSRGFPVPDARVQAVGLPTEHGESPITAQRVDELGRFRLDGLTGSRARLRATAPGHYPMTLEHVAPGANLRLVLQRR